MNQPVKIQFINCQSTPAIESRIHERIEKLERHFSPLINGKVTVEKPHRSKKHGLLYRVTVHLTAPGKDLFAGKTPDNNPAHEDVYVAIRDTFDVMERQLKHHFDQLRKEVKFHESRPTGQVIKLFPEEGYGFIQSMDGRQIYFNENSVLNKAFSKLNLGTQVRFVEELGNQGPQASTIECVRPSREGSVS